MQFFSFLKNLPEILRPFSICTIASKPENIDSAEMKKQQLMDQKLIDFISLKDGSRIEKSVENEKEAKEEPDASQKRDTASQTQQLGLFAASRLLKSQKIHSKMK